MAPAAVTQLAQKARSFITERVPTTTEARTLAGNAAQSLALRPRDGATIEKRDEYRYDPHQGMTDTHDINNTAIFVVFGLIGAAFVCTGIWFFFWAKNGGFHFKENDWEEYKSTVLRRKGPNGTLLSGATPSTDLGGGSVYKDFDDTTTVVTESTALSGITAGASDIAAREKREKKRRHKEREREARRNEKSRSSRRNKDQNGNVIEEEAEREAKHHLRNYRHEKPARVGGLNKESEASEWDGSTNPADSSVSSNLLSNREGTPTSSPAKPSGGIRKVYSTADRNAERESERIRAEARRLAERGRSAVNSSEGGYSPYRNRSSRRDFSYQMAGSTMDESDVGLQRGSRIMEEYSDVGGSDLGTKTYQHSLRPPTTNNGGGGSDYAEEKRRNRRQGGYRRDRE